MKDSYSFDISEEEGRISYSRMFLSYLKTFQRMGLKAIPMEAESGPIGGNLSHEFIILANTGESKVYIDKRILDLEIADNVDYENDSKNIVEEWTQYYSVTDDMYDQKTYEKKVGKENRLEMRGIEVGHVFFFGDKYTKPLKANVQDSEGKINPIQSGSYGIGVSRLVAAIIEASHDDKGIIWPKSVSPFDYVLLNLSPKDENLAKLSDVIYKKISQNNSLLYDDTTSSVGEKLNKAKKNAKRETGERILGNDPKSGRQLSVKLGKYGPIAQIGKVDEEEKPIFASLTKDQQLDTISLEEALELFKFPKEIGSHKGETVTVNNGRYGPYIKFSNKSISIPNGIDPNTVDLNIAKELIDEKLKSEEPIHTYNEKPVTKGKGRFGPFIKWNDIFINVNKIYDFDNLSKNDIEELIELKIQKEKEKLVSDWVDEGIKVEKGRWGRSIISSGKKKVEIPKEVDPKTITLDIAKQYLNPKKKK